MSYQLSALVVLMEKEEWLVAIAARATAVLHRLRPKSKSTVLLDSAERATAAWDTLRSRGWLRPASCSLLYLTFDLVALRMVFLAARQPVTFSVLIAGYGVPILLGRASFLPGGIAVIEVAMAAIYGGLGIPANVAVVVVLLMYRLLSFWLPTAIGIPLAVGLQSKRVSTQVT